MYTPCGPCTDHYFIIIIFFSSNEVWFDDVDPDDLENITGKRTKTSGGDPNDSLVTGNLEGLVLTVSERNL